jgi:N-acetyl-gamma-glutamyl-phosphate/LysW-gamma-L-alpha-aminoadipyl-6-phosphate reductase
MAKLRVGIVGASGYTGGELLRIFLHHPKAEVVQATSESHSGRGVGTVHPNLRGRSSLSFTRRDDLAPCDALFLCLPHGEAASAAEALLPMAERVLDLSADFRLHDPAAYPRWYGFDHPRPDLLGRFVYGIPELHRGQIRASRTVAVAGCNATAVILALHPLFAEGIAPADGTVVEVKVGSSEGGAAFSASSHHPERAHCLRSYRPTGHRHQAEIEQELALRGPVRVHLSATAVDEVRGLLATAQVFPTRPIDEKELWRLYRRAYGEEPFVRIVKGRDGNYRYPEPKVLWGTNSCEVGFELDAASGRLVVISALDNLVKGGAGQAIQCFNLMHGFPETAGLEFPGLHPV